MLLQIQNYERGKVKHPRTCAQAAMAGLEAAVRAGDVAGVVDAIEGLGEDLSALDADLEAGACMLGKGGALHLASFLGCLPVLEVLLRGSDREDQGHGGDKLRAALERTITSGATALMCAAHAGQEAAAALLLARGTDTAATLGRRCGDGWTALMLAAQQGHTATATVLLDSGADVAATSNSGTTALMWAVKGGHAATAALLLDRGADVAFGGQQGTTALMRAAEKGDSTMATLLLNRGAPRPRTATAGRRSFMRCATATPTWPRCC